VTTSDPSSAARRPRRRGLAGLLGVAGVLVASTMVWKASTAAFTATTTNGVNTFSTGTVTLTDSDTSAAMFTVPVLTPGGSGTACIRVTYNGSLASTVKLYTSGLTATNSLDSYLTMKVEQGATAPANAAGNFSCANFTPAGTLNNTTLAAFGAASTAWSNGVDAWAVTGAAQTRDYRFTYTFSAGAPDSVQNSSASVSFVWEAQSN